MAFRHRERMPLTLWLGINLLAAILGLFATLRLVIWIWEFLYGFYQVPTADFPLFPASKDFTLRLFFIVGFGVAGVLIGLVIGLVKWWRLRHSGGVLSRQVLLSTTTRLIGLPLSYEIVATFNDLFKFNSSFLNAFPPYLPLALFLIYFIGEVIASSGEWLVLQITEVYFALHG